MERTRLLWLLSLIFTLNAASADDQELALRKAAEAAYIQTGLKSEVDKVTGMAKRYGSSEGKRLARKYEAEKPLAVILGGVQLYRTRTLTLPVGKNKTLTLKQDSVSYTIGF